MNMSLLLPAIEGLDWFDVQCENGQIRVEARTTCSATICPVPVEHLLIRDPPATVKARLRALPMHVGAIRGDVAQPPLTSTKAIVLPAMVPARRGSSKNGNEKNGCRVIPGNRSCV